MAAAILGSLRYVYLVKFLLSFFFRSNIEGCSLDENDGRFGPPFYLHRSVRPELAVENLFRSCNAG